MPTTLAQIPNQMTAAGSWRSLRRPGIAIITTEADTPATSAHVDIGIAMAAFYAWLGHPAQ